MTNPWPGYLEQNRVWHDRYGERGEFWPDGRPASTFMSARCRGSDHRGCFGKRSLDGTIDKDQIVPCECVCHSHVVDSAHGNTVH